MGRFDDRATQPARGPSDIFRWRVLDRIRGKAPAREPDHGVGAPVRDNDGALVRDLASSLTWIGHASFLLRMGGLYVTIDPIWSERIQGVVRRLARPGVALELVPKIDVVLVSHNHYDHLDLPTLKRIGPGALYVVPLGMASVLRGAGLSHVVELDWWQRHTVGELEVTLVPARHWSMRAPWDRNDSLWGGWLVRGPEGVAYHSGDTGMFEGFREIGKVYGAIDWAMLPIGAYDPTWFMSPQHMGPEEATRAFEIMGAKTLCAMHWGTFKLTDEPMGEPPERARRAFTERKLGDERLHVYDIGEMRDLVRI